MGAGVNVCPWGRRSLAVRASQKACPRGVLAFEDEAARLLEVKGLDGMGGKHCLLRG